MNRTPNSERLHIVFAGERNSGKSSLLNAVAGQEVSIVSDVAGTTTDHVSKAMELPGLGACLLVDTAGLDDSGHLGAKRVGASLDALRSADAVVLVIDATTGRIPAVDVAEDVPVLPVINKSDLLSPADREGLAADAARRFGRRPLFTCALLKAGAGELIAALRTLLAECCASPSIVDGLAAPGDLVVLVMPQDGEAPKGRLILPQQQVLRALLDLGCKVMCCSTDRLAETLASLRENPVAIVTDSRDFAAVKKLTTGGVSLTSFSILFAASKGDLEYFKEGARKVDSLRPSSRVLIAEACTHAPASEDIGRVRIPSMLRARIGEDLRIDFVSGHDFPEDLGVYDLVVHCGACMFNRRYVLSRVRQAREQGVPMTNYGVLIAYLHKTI